MVLGTAQHRLDQFVGLKLGERLVGPDLMGPLHADLAGEGGVQNDVSLRQPGVALHLEGQLVPVQPRHLDVAHQDVDPPALGDVGLHQGQGVPSVGADLVGDVDVIQRRHQLAAGDGGVVHQQDPHRLEPLALHVGQHGIEVAGIVRIDPRQDELDIQQLDQLLSHSGHAGDEHVLSEGGRRRLDVTPVALGDLVDAPHQEAHQGAAAIGDDDEAVGHLLPGDGAIAHRHRHVDHGDGCAPHAGGPEHGRMRLRQGGELGVGHYLLHLESADGEGLSGREVEQQHALGLVGLARHGGCPVDLVGDGQSGVQHRGW